MEDGNFWTNFFGQFKDLNDWIKALTIVAPFASLTICFLAWLRHKERCTQKANEEKRPPNDISQDRYQEANTIEGHAPYPNALESIDPLVLDALKASEKLQFPTNKTPRIAPPNRKPKS